MTNSAPTSIYSASAGSGKTYQLTRNYLTLLLSHPEQPYHRKILAVTFTNKAVAEMKQRIIKRLEEFSSGSSSILFSEIASELNLEHSELATRSKHVLRRVLHDYSAFDIVTIDSFNHRLLRTFSKELGLDTNFEVELDTLGLLDKAIDNLLARAGKDPELTGLLIDFSLSKIDRGKSWDIRYDLKEVAKLIASENHYRQLKNFRKMEGGDFVRFRESVKKDIDHKSKFLTDLTKSLATKAAELNLEKKHFAGGVRGFWNLVEKVDGGDFSTTPDKKYMLLGPEDKLHSSKATKAQIEQIDTLKTEILDFLQAYQNLAGEIMFLGNLYKQITPLSVLGAIVKEIELIKKEEKILPIFEFNALLTEQISGEPAPFIYERLGERYRHFFIDEFQDTSIMQWQNLKPLISHAVNSIKNNRSGSLMLVGDAKQSIYRWRGGEPDQFIDLLASEKTFNQDISQLVLESNWRSYSTIIDFNNGFFTGYAGHLRHPAYARLYADYLKQEATGKEGGYVQIDFIEKEKGMLVEEKKELHIQQVISNIQNARNNGFHTGEICILTRNNKDGLAVTTALAERNIPVVSNEALLVSTAPEVGLLVALIRWNLQPEDLALKVAFLSSYGQYNKVDDLHGFITEYQHSSAESIFQDLLDTDYQKSHYPTVYETIEVLSEQLGVLRNSDARLREFLEYAREFSIVKGVSIQEWLKDWEDKQDKLSVSASPEGNAIQVMTIHKAKGLEFPVVIAPFIEDDKLDSTGTSNDLEWFYTGETPLYGQSELLLATKNELAYYPEPIAQQYDLYLQKAEMDNVNVLYVAFTRAVEQLYIIADLPKKSNSQASLLRVHAEKHLKPDTSHSYSIGSTKRISEPHSLPSSVEMTTYNSNSGTLQHYALNEGALWAQGKDTDLDWGNLVHRAMAQIKVKGDFDRFRESVIRHAHLAEKEKQRLIDTVQNILELPELQPYFQHGVQVYNERRIRSADGKSHVPDRIVKDQNKVAILDYKTGLPEEAHQQQLNTYARLMAEMGYEVTDKLLVYTDSQTVQKVA